MSNPFTISNIQSHILKMQASRLSPRKTAVPKEYYDALAFHESLQIGRFTFDCSFDRIFKLNDKLVYILGTTQSEYDEEEVDGTLVEYEYVWCWCYDTRDGKYRRFVQRWTTGDAAEDLDALDVHLCTANQMKLYKTDMSFDSLEMMLETLSEPETPYARFFQLIDTAWDTYTLETFDTTMSG